MRTRLSLAGALVCALAVAGGAAAMAQASPSVYVWLPTTMKASALERLLEDAMPGVSVTVFGRVNDFKSALESSPPDAVIALPAALQAFDLNSNLQGLSGASDAEPYILVTTDGALTRAELSSRAIGAVDLLGRKKMPGFVASLFGLDAPPRIQSVTKVEDLLPLLQFKSADAVIMPESAFADFQSRSRIDLKQIKVEGARVSRAAVSFVNSERRPVLEKAIAGLPPSVTLQLGVDRWKTR